MKTPLSDDTKAVILGIGIAGCLLMAIISLQRYGAMLQQKKLQKTTLEQRIDLLQKDRGNATNGPVYLKTPEGIDPRPGFLPTVDNKNDLGSPYLPDKINIHKEPFWIGKRILTNDWSAPLLSFRSSIEFMDTTSPMILHCKFSGRLLGMDSNGVFILINEPQGVEKITSPFKPTVQQDGTNWIITFEK